MMHSDEVEILSIETMLSFSVEMDEAKDLESLFDQTLVQCSMKIAILADNCDDGHEHLFNMFLDQANQAFMNLQQMKPKN